MTSMMSLAVCEVLDGRRILLKKETEGMGNGKWVGLSVELDRNSDPAHCAATLLKREVGLVAPRPLLHGVCNFYKGTAELPFVKAHIFSVKVPGGIGSRSRGMRWFNLGSIPYDKMWDDDLFWLPLVVNGRRFNGSFVYDRNMKRVVNYRISLR